MKQRLRSIVLVLGAPALVWAAASGLRGDTQEATPTPAQRLEYAALLEDLLGHVTAGRIDEAVALFDENSVGLNDAARESLRSQFTTLHTAGGPCDGIEIVAVQPISPRLHRAFALMHFERSPIVFAVQVRQLRGRWSLSHFHYSADVVQVLGTAPVQFLSESAAGDVATGR